MTHHEHEKIGGNRECRVCTSHYAHEKNPSHFGICEKCAYKILIVLFILMIVASYIAWFGIL
jgi:hypothetical protein